MIKDLILTNRTEIQFIKRLHYWIGRGKYGIEYNGHNWIYNTLDDWANQLGVSKRSIQRCISSLKQKGIVKSAFLSSNKRDRTLFYTIDYNNFDINSLTKKHVKKSSSHMANSEEKLKLNDHMIDHMYIIDNINIINKSYKSINKDTLKNSEKNTISNPSKTQKTEKLQQNTTIQDMLKELKTEFPNIPVFLNKTLARNLVAAFKLKFKNSITKWHEFLKLVKTSVYLMSEKFHLTLQWLLKFSTIDRLFQGDLGVKLKEILFSKTEEEEREIQQNQQKEQEKVLEQIETCNETQKCKNIRLKLFEKLDVLTYQSYFKEAIFKELEDGKVIIEVQNNFKRDRIVVKFLEILADVNILSSDVHSSTEISYIEESNITFKHSEQKETDNSDKVNIDARVENLFCLGKKRTRFRKSFVF